MRHKITPEYSVSTVGEDAVVLLLRDGLKLLWTGRNTYITVGSNYQNQTCGLCGTYNFNKGDDFHTRYAILWNYFRANCGASSLSSAAKGVRKKGGQKILYHVTRGVNH